MILRVALVMFSSIASLAAQLLMVPSTPVAPGGQLPITIFNSSSSSIGLDLFVLTGTGDLVLPRTTGCVDGFQVLPPNQSLSTWLPVPATGPGSSGTHLLYLPNPWGGSAGAVARFHVQSVSPSFPSIHSFPHFAGGYSRHQVSFAYPQTTPWVICNSGAAAMTFAGADRIEIVPPGGAAVSIYSLAGLTIAPGAVSFVTLPIAGLQPGPYTVKTVWQDPQQGQVVQTTGIREARNVELHLPTGRVLPVGGSLTAYLNLNYSNPAASSAPVAYALCVGLQAGTFALPGGALIPLVDEPVVIWSVTNSLFGLLVNNVGIATDVSSPNCGDARFVTNDIVFNHPNLPAYAGTELHLAAVSLSQAFGTFGASQGETILLQ